MQYVYIYVPIYVYPYVSVYVCVCVFVCRPTEVTFLLNETVCADINKLHLSSLTHLIMVNLCDMKSMKRVQFMHILAIAMQQDIDSVCQQEYQFKQMYNHTQKPIYQVQRPTQERTNRMRCKKKPCKQIIYTNPNNMQPANITFLIIRAFQCITYKCRTKHSI